MSQVVSNTALSRILLLLVVAAGVFFFIGFLVPVLAALIPGEVAFFADILRIDRRRKNNGYCRALRWTGADGITGLHLARVAT